MYRLYVSLAGVRNVFVLPAQMYVCILFHKHSNFNLIEIEMLAKRTKLLVLFSMGAINAIKIALCRHFLGAFA